MLSSWPIRLFWHTLCRGLYSVFTWFKVRCIFVAGRAANSMIRIFLAIGFVSSMARPWWCGTQDWTGSLTGSFFAVIIWFRYYDGFAFVEIINELENYRFCFYWESLFRWVLAICLGNVKLNMRNKKESKIIVEFSCNHLAPTILSII